MPWWAIYYRGGVRICGRSREHWRSAPREGVQALVLYLAPEVHCWTDPFGQNVTDRHLWTGVDEYEVFPGWGVKYGAWMDRPGYDAIFAAACVDPPPEVSHGN